jgi:anti-anti-sigma factor
MSLTAPQAASGYALGLTIGRICAQLRVDGEIDIAAAADLSRLMESLDLLAHMAVEANLRGVTFLDSFGVAPLVDATRRRARNRLPPVLIVERSSAARYFLDVARLGGEPHLDFSAWDRVGAPEGAARRRRSFTPRLPAEDSRSN